jgi:hypothetical protein
MMKNLMILTLILVSCTALNGQAPVDVDTQDLYESSPQHPFGRMNPDAPPETKQFEFIVGTFTCKDRIMNPADGKWYDIKSIRRAEYILNGHAIQDKNYTNITVASNIRIYDPVKKEWVVSYFKVPFGIGVWRGVFKDGKPEVIQGDEKGGSRLSFFNISKEGYSWKGERLKEGKASLFWEFTCRRTH